MSDHEAAKDIHVYMSSNPEYTCICYPETKNTHICHQTQNIHENVILKPRIYMHMSSSPEYT